MTFQHFGVGHCRVPLWESVPSMANNLQGNICSRSLGCRLVAATYFATVHQQWCNVRRINKTDQSNGYISLAACWHAHGSALVMAVLGVQVFFWLNDIENWCINKSVLPIRKKRDHVVLGCWHGFGSQASELPCLGHASPVYSTRPSAKIAVSIEATEAKKPLKQDAWERLEPCNLGKPIGPFSW